jgi:phenylacetate-CoA ligase
MSRELTQAMDLIEHLEAAPSSELTAYLQARLQALLDHAGRHCPHYRRSLAAAGWAPGRALTSASWMRVPVLTRTALQEDADALRSESVPPVCGRTAWAASSGSTGRAVRVLGTEQQMGIWQAITVREHLEHRRDLSGRMAYIKVGGDSREHSGEGRDYPDWGPPVSLLHRTGPASALGIDASTAEQARWLAERDPHYLLTYPANLEGLVAALDEAGIALPALRQVRTLGEVVTDELRARVGERLGVTLADLYSAAEVGYVATQVPDTTHYRCRSEGDAPGALRDRRLRRGHGPAAVGRRATPPAADRRPGTQPHAPAGRLPALAAPGAAAHARDRAVYPGAGRADRPARARAQAGAGGPPQGTLRHHRRGDDPGAGCHPAGGGAQVRGVSLRAVSRRRDASETGISP